jgi:hypothetical protein
MASIQIEVVNQSTALTDTEVQSAIPALQTQLHRDFASVWGIDADLTFLPRNNTPAANAWTLGIFDTSDQAGALGYHELSPQGTPLAKVFAASDSQAGLSWTVTASHELLEMLADPEIDLTVFVQKQNSKGGVIYAYEVCDAVEDDSLGYNINGILVSDFVYPAWFESFRAPSSTQFDYGNHLTQPFQLLSGGYIGEFDVTAGSGWKQVTVEGKAARGRFKGRVDSRFERRSKPRNKWRRSRILGQASVFSGFIKNIVIILQENHTFDNYFGTYSNSEGLSGKNICLPITANSQNCVKPFHDSNLKPVDMNHNWNSAHQDYDGGKMDGFVYSEGNQETMGYHDRNEIPRYWTAADNYVLCDRYFTSVMSESAPNHLHLVTGSCGGIIDDNVPAKVNLPCVFQELDEIGVSWKVYSASTYYKSLEYVQNTSKAIANFVVGSAFSKDLAAGNLPQVSWIIGAPGGDEHPPANIQTGQKFSMRHRKPTWKEQVLEWASFFRNMG